MTVLIQLRRDDAATWTSVDPILEEGELGLELDTWRIKFGDGVTEWTALPYSTNGSQLMGMVYMSDTASQTDADPGFGNLRWNNATPASATELYLSDNRIDGADISALPNALGTGGLLYIQEMDNSGNWQLWQIVSAETTSDYWKLQVELIASDGTMGDDKLIMLDFAPGTPMSFPAASGTVGYLEIPQNSRSAAYTTVLSDSGKHLLHPAADTTARTFTIDSNANVPYPVGTAITFVNQNAAGTLTIAITSDAMRLAGPGTTGSRTLAANGIATALKITSTEWIINGTGLT